MPASAAAPRLGAVWALLIAFVFALALPALAAFPALSGRVVDDAKILSLFTQANLEAKLADLEAKSGIQLVVATVKGLDGKAIEPYANDLFREWKLGQAKQDNGVLLLVAPNEHRVRIEVGPGLEGVLTDAVSSVIITNAITPSFKAGDFDAGVTKGVDDIVLALTTDTTQWVPKPEPSVRDAYAKRSGKGIAFGTLGFYVAVLGLILLARLLPRETLIYIGFQLLGAVLQGASSGGRSSGGGYSGGGGGGFSGGGGTSSGGGASGSW